MGTDKQSKVHSMLDNAKQSIGNPWACYQLCDFVVLGCVAVTDGQAVEKLWLAVRVMDAAWATIPTLLS